MRQLDKTISFTKGNETKFILWSANSNDCMNYFLKENFDNNGVLLTNYTPYRGESECS